MLNGFAFQKRLDEYNQNQIETKKKSKLENKHVKEREQLAGNYNHRISNFIRDMSIDPVEIKNYQPSVSQFRPKEDRSKMLGEALIRTKSFVTERIRIQQSIDHYRNLLDTEGAVPKKLVHDFRERNISKEIQPKMRFTAATQLERVVDAINEYRNSAPAAALKDANFKKSKSLSHLIVETMHKNLQDSLQKQQNTIFQKKLHKDTSLNESSQVIHNDSMASNLNDYLKKKKDQDNRAFYATTSSSRLRQLSSKFMNQNIFFAKEINKYNRKLHFQAAQAVQLQVPGSLQKQLGPKEKAAMLAANMSASNGDEIGGSGVNGSMSKTQQSFINRQKMQQQMQASKSSFYLPIAKPKFEKDPTKANLKAAFSQTMTSMNAKSHFELPQVKSPLQISKEKQREMANYIDKRSLNPYDQNKKKHQIHSHEDDLKIYKLLAASYTESSFYNLYYKPEVTATAAQGGANPLVSPKNMMSPGTVLSPTSMKKLRFAGQPGVTESGGQDMQPNFGFGTDENFNKPSQPFKARKSAFMVQGQVDPQKTTSSQAIEDFNYNEVDQVAGDILVNCNAVNDRSKFTVIPLKKGDGKMTGGSGLTNYEIYTNLMKNY